MELSELHFQTLEQYIHTAKKEVDRLTTTRLNGKVDALRGPSNGRLTGRLVHNLSSLTLTHSQLTLLQRDTGHNLMDAQLLDFIAALEPAMHDGDMGEEARNNVKQQIAGLLIQHRHHETLSREEWVALNQLKRNSPIIVLPADKGRATVILDRTEYESKALSLLEDVTAYRVVDKDPRTQMTNKINKLLNKLRRLGRIDDNTVKKMRPKDAALPRFYGLPKIHRRAPHFAPLFPSGALLLQD